MTLPFFGLKAVANPCTDPTDVPNCLRTSRWICRTLLLPSASRSDHRYKQSHRREARLRIKVLVYPRTMRNGRLSKTTFAIFTSSRTKLWWQPCRPSWRSMVSKHRMDNHTETTYKSPANTLLSSVRKWKMKLDEWGYQKYLSEQDVTILIAKADRRAKHEGKDTACLLNGLMISDSRFDNFKRRKDARKFEGASPSNRKLKQVSSRSDAYSHSL